MENNKQTQEQVANQQNPYGNKQVDAYYQRINKTLRLECEFWEYRARIAHAMAAEKESLQRLAYLTNLEEGKEKSNEEEEPTTETQEKVEENADTKE